MPIHFTTVHFRGVQLAKNDFGLVFIFGFAQKLHFPVPFRFYKIDCGFVFFGSFFAQQLSFMPLWYEARNDVYFRAELVQLVVSLSNCELEVRRYGMKKNTLTDDPIMLEEEL